MAKKTAVSTFDKDLFKRSVLYNVKTLYRKSLEEATDQQIFQAEIGRASCRERV